MYILYDTHHPFHNKLIKTTWLFISEGCNTVHKKDNNSYDTDISRFDTAIWFYICGAFSAYTLVLWPLVRAKSEEIEP